MIVNIRETSERIYIYIYMYIVIYDGVRNNYGMSYLKFHVAQSSGTHLTVELKNQKNIIQAIPSF